eukprot:1140334-Pelagomonas_calceolata.AAC.3
MSIPCSVLGSDLGVLCGEEAVQEWLQSRAVQQVLSTTLNSALKPCGHKMKGINQGCWCLQITSEVSWQRKRKYYRVDNSLPCC